MPITSIIMDTHPAQAPTDDELILEALGGQPATVNAAFDQLYARHAAALAAYVATRVRRDGLEDLLQEIWTRALRKIHLCRDRTNFRRWLFAVGKHMIIDYHRKRQPEQLADGFDPADERGPGDAFAAMVEVERTKALAGCLEKLKPKLREIVELRLGGTSYERICANLSITAARAQKYWFRAKEWLQDCVERALS